MTKTAQTTTHIDTNIEKDKIISFASIEDLFKKDCERENCRDPESNKNGMMLISS